MAREEDRSNANGNARFDVVVIGAGPTAIAALDGLTGTKRVAVVTGATPSLVPSDQLHPKIQAVSIHRREMAGVAELVMHAAERKPLFSTAAVGGLANY